MADPDLRAEVLKGIERATTRVRVTPCDRPEVSDAGETALRHLREIAERHKPIPKTVLCELCCREMPCPTLLSLAPDYAPQALAQMEADRGK